MSRVNLYVLGFPVHEPVYKSVCKSQPVDNYVYISCVLLKVVYRLISLFCVLAHIYNAMMGSGPWRRWLDYLIDFAGY